MLKVYSNSFSRSSSSQHGVLAQTIVQAPSLRQGCAAASHFKACRSCTHGETTGLCHAAMSCAAVLQPDLSCAVNTVLCRAGRCCVSSADESQQTEIGSLGAWAGKGATPGSINPGRNIMLSMCAVLCPFLQIPPSRQRLAAWVPGRAMLHPDLPLIPRAVLCCAVCCCFFVCRCLQANRGRQPGCLGWQGRHPWLHQPWAQHKAVNRHPAIPGYSCSGCWP